MSKQFVSKAVGIDLGTTNSVVTVMNPADAEIVIHKERGTKRETTPSCVWKDPRSGQIVVGSRAYGRIGHKPTPIRSIKRSMGKQIKVLLTNEQVTPEEVSAHILREMKRQIEEDVTGFNTSTTSWRVDRAIITVPAYFDMPQIDATRKAGEMAGLQVLELLHEPTAAACYHCWDTGTQNGLFLVYDLGGGTFDVSVLRCTEGAFEVLGISGNTRLGGDDIDTELAECLLKRLQLDLDIKNNEDDKLLFDSFKLLMEGIKKTLSTRDCTYAMLRDTSLFDKTGARIDIESPFERHEIEELIRPIVERTIPYCFEAMEIAQKKADVTLADVDAIILAGGSTHIPLVREMVRQALCADPTAQEPRAKCAEPFYDEEKADKIVALGAAIRAAAIGGLAIYNPEQTVRVSFGGTAATSAKKAHIGGKVEALTPELDLKGGAVRLIIPGLDFEDEEELSESGAFGFKRIPLQASTENLLTFEILDKKGTLVATVDRPITQSERSRPIDDGKTAILAKDIMLEVNEGGSSSLYTLLPAMTTLPASAEHKFAHPGGTEEVRLVLYQRQKKIYEVPIRVPLTLPKGTPIDLNIHVDEMNFITVKGTIGDKSFGFPVDIPKEKPPTQEDVATLEEDFSKVLDNLPPEEQKEAKKQWQSIEEALEKANKRGDKDQAIHEFGNQEELVASLSGRVKRPLYPPKEEFDELVQKCFNFNQQAYRVASTTGQPYDFAEIEKDIASQQQQGEKAYADGDQKAYAKAIKMLEAHRSHAIEVLEPYSEREDLRTPEQKASDAIVSILADADLLMADAQGRIDLQNQIKQIKNGLNDLKRNVGRNPHSALQEAWQLYQHLRQIRNILMGDEGGIGNLPIRQG